jgi:hypothetical protein
MYEVESLIIAAREAARGSKSKDSAFRFLTKAENIVRAQDYLSKDEKSDMIRKIRDVGDSL